MGPPAVATRRPALLAPDGFPPFSWPTGVVYDVDLDIVTVVTLGGEGFFYRYDARKKQWLDYRSLNNIDITSIAYDPQAKRYAAWTSEGALLSLSSKGEPLGRTKDLKSQLTGFGALYDRGNARPPPLMLAPRRFPSRVAAPLRKPTPDTTSAERPLRSAADWRHRPTADIAPDGSDGSKAVVRIPAVPSPMREAAGAGGIPPGHDMLRSVEPRSPSCPAPHPPTTSPGDADRSILVRMTPPDAQPARKRRNPLREGGRSCKPFHPILHTRSVTRACCSMC
jgi:hypothetical protein